MNPSGYQQVKEVLANADIEPVEIQPVPAEGENVRYVEIFGGYAQKGKFTDIVRGEQILNALEQAGLMYVESGNRLDQPSFSVLSRSTEPMTRRTVVTLEDLHVK